jgi:hypothetical protein
MMLGMINKSEIFLDWRKRKCDHVRDKTNALQ